MKWLKRLFGKAGFDPSLQVLSDEVLANTWGAGSSGGQSGETIYKWNDDMAPEWRSLLPRANEISTRGYQPYGGERVAGLSLDQTGAGDSIRHLATEGSTIGNAGRNTAYETAQGKNLGSYDSQGNWVSANPYANNRTIPGQNEYSGLNEAFMQMKGRNLQDVTKNFQEGTAADTQRMFAQSGAFGGSAHQQAQKNNADTLGKTLADMSTRMESEQYDRSANLKEADINRGMQAQMYDQGRLTDDYRIERGHQQAAIPLAMQGEQGIMDLYRQRMGVGDLYRDDAQRRLDVNYGNYTQGMDWDRNNANWLASLFGTAQGSTGVSQQFGGYGGVNPVAGLLGAAALGRGMDLY